MPSFTYNPPPGEPQVIRTLGRTITAGEAFEIADDDPLLTKFRGNPQFEGEGGPEDDFAKQQAEANAKARDELQDKRKELTEARQEAAGKLAEVDAEERSLALSERALGTLSPAEQRAMEQLRGIGGGAEEDDVTGGGVVGRTGIGGPLEPDNQAKAEDRPQE